MTVTVVADPLFVPPRIQVTVTVPSGNIMANPVLSRIVNGVAEQVREQPSAGFDTRTISDYEMPYDVPVTYEFTTDYSTPSGTTVWDETWPNLSAWTTAYGSFTVSSGTATTTSTAAQIDRAVSSTAFKRVVISSLATTVSTGGVNNSSISFGPANQVQLFVTPTGKVRVVDGVGLRSTVTTITASAPITIDFLNQYVVITGTGGTWTSALRSNTNFTDVTLRSDIPAGTGSFTVGEVKITNYPTSSSTDQLSSPVAISPLQPWLIHPSNPGLSMPLSSKDRSAVAIRSVGEVSNTSTITEHPILGQALPITTTSGPRLGSKYQLQLMSRTAAQERAIMGLVSDGTPLLFRAPFIYPIGIEEGFYAVGDVTRTRLADRLGDETRFITLPLTRVQSPIVNVQNTGWSWAALAAQFATWADEANGYASWADVFTNNRKPGY